MVHSFLYKAMHLLRNDQVGTPNHQALTLILRYSIRMPVLTLRPDDSLTSNASMFGLLKGITLLSGVREGTGAVCFAISYWVDHACPGRWRGSRNACQPSPR